MMVDWCWWLMNHQLMVDESDGWVQGLMSGWYWLMPFHDSWFIFGEIMAILVDDVAFMMDRLIYGLFVVYTWVIHGESLVTQINSHEWMVDDALRQNWFIPVFADCLRRLAYNYNNYWWTIVSNFPSNARLLGYSCDILWSIDDKIGSR